VYPIGFKGCVSVPCLQWHKPSTRTVAMPTAHSHHLAPQGSAWSLLLHQPWPSRCALCAHRHITPATALSQAPDKVGLYSPTTATKLAPAAGIMSSTSSWFCRTCRKTQMPGLNVLLPALGSVGRVGKSGLNSLACYRLGSTSTPAARQTERSGAVGTSAPQMR
jgi:hypothetical protein